MSRLLIALVVVILVIGGGLVALAGRNISVQSGASDDVYGFARMERHAVQLVDADGKLAFDRDTLRVAARSALIDVLSARENRTNSGIVARLAGDAIGADGFLPTMGTEEFLSCLSRQALERSCKNTPVLPRARVKDMRAALVEHLTEQRFVHPSAAFAPAAAEVATWRSKSAVVAGEDADVTADDADSGSGDAAALDELDPEAIDEAYRVAAE